MCDTATGYIARVRDLSREQIETFTTNTKILIIPDDTDDMSDVLEFIIHWNQRGITKFVLHLPSDNIISLNELIEKTPSLRCCSFVASMSNAAVAREKTTNSKIYYPLTVLTDLLKTFTGKPPNPNVNMIVVSNDSNPYFTEILNSGPEPAYRISELTVEKVNDFAQTGVDILVAFSYPDEMDRFVEILNDPKCQYSRQITFMELREIFVEKALKLSKVNSIIALSSGVSMSATSDVYPGVTTQNPYDNCSLIFTNNSKVWKQLRETGVLRKGSTYFGSNTVQLI